MRQEFACYFDPTRVTRESDKPGGSALIQNDCKTILVICPGTNQNEFELGYGTRSSTVPPSGALLDQLYIVERVDAHSAVSDNIQGLWAQGNVHISCPEDDTLVGVHKKT